MAEGVLAPEHLAGVIRHTHAEAMYRQFASSHGWLAKLTADDKSKLVGSFKEREGARREAISELIRNQHLSEMPRGGMGAMGVVRAEIAKRRAHKPIRRLMTEAGAAIQQMKPVFLMSPISVAQFLPPGLIEFDLLVIDEASQVRPEDAIGAVARARQIVVVGDKRQLPPTSFFDRMISDSAEEEWDDDVEPTEPKAAAATELESILTACEARGLNSRMLKWHYRSRHPSLIEVSNEVFYSDNGGLILFPSPHATRDVDGLTLRRVPGAYDRGGKRHNIVEADEVAKAVAAHARDYRDRSLGVVTFSTAQRDRINESLAHLRLTDEALDTFMREGKAEEFFVKNIENVQGDERDVIFVSVGYGPRISGARLDSMAFGPVSTEGGERRLNVLFTRARYRTVAFVSFDPNDIDVSRTKSAGAQILKRFLVYAATGISHQPVILEADPDSDFEVSVAAEVRRHGYDVNYQVGSAGYRIDLAVKHPEYPDKFMLAIECDGATYHSSVWARERDRQRQEVLEGLGWIFHRVWSTDWFHRREEEVRRLEAALREAKTEALNKATLRPVPEPVEDSGVEPDGDLEQAPFVPDLPEYVEADFRVDLRGEPHLAPIPALASIVEKIVGVEGPIHEEEIARRVASLFGKQRAGSRIVLAVQRALAHLARSKMVMPEDAFWMNATQAASPPLRNRSRAPSALRKASLIPPIEIAAAVRKVLQHNGAVNYDEIPRAVALLFGFQRTGPEFQQTILPIVDSMVEGQELSRGPDGLRLTTSEQDQT